MTHSFYPTPSGPLPPKQAEVYAFIHEELRAGRRFPTARLIAERMGWKQEASANDCLMRLVWRGKVKMSAIKPTKKSPKRYAWELVA